MLAAAHGAVQVWGIAGKIRFAVVHGNPPKRCPGVLLSLSDTLDEFQERQTGRDALKLAVAGAPKACRAKAEARPAVNRYGIHEVF